MRRLYGDLGMDKRLRDIVFAGAHDAGITGGSANTQTQTKDIYAQARSGVRLFDLRIMAGAAPSIGGAKTVALMAYHSGGLIKTESKHRVLAGTGSARTIERSKLRVGAFGMSLTQMLQDARKYVKDYKSEFLILKFDKCTNWSVIAEYCVGILGDVIYDGAGDLNRKTLTDLKGKVIVLFSGDGLLALQGAYGPHDGILGHRNLFSKGAPPKSYDAQFNGLQYFGKGGTSTNPVTMKWSHHGKIDDNHARQQALMSQMANSMTAHSSDVLGMMYWTSTGLVENISKRNEKMWGAAGKDSLENLWKAGLQESIAARMNAKRVKMASYSGARWMKTFIPNIIMIDFANSEKCRTIYNLNKLAETELVGMAKKNATAP